MMTKADFDAITAALNDALWKKGNDPATVMDCAVAVGKACESRSKGEFDGVRFLRDVTKGTHVSLEKP